MSTRFATDSHSSRHRRAAARLAALTILLIGGCDRNGEALPVSWDTEPDEHTPTVVERRDRHPALSDLPDLALGQPEAEAVDRLEAYCPATVRRDADPWDAEAYFLGCRVEDDSPVRFLRVGFWPRLENRVATLEVKREGLPPIAVWRDVRGVFSDRADVTLRHRLIRVEADRYRLMADWDRGRDGPTHLTLGFAPQIDSVPGAQ